MAQKYDTLDAYWHDIKSIPMLTEEEEHQLAEQIHAGSERAIERLVTSNLRFVVSVARQYAEKAHEEGIDIDDLISEGNIAMMLAARKWNPKADGRFVNYAVHDVKKAIAQALPQQGPMLTLPKHDTSAAKGMRRFSTDAPVHPGQTNTLGDMLRSGNPTTDDHAETNEVSYTLSRALDYLNERERDVITLYYGVGRDDHLTMAEIGEKKGLARERVRQIRKTAERKMRRALKSRRG